MLRFVEALGTYSVYEREDGTEVFVAHGFPRRFLVEYSVEWALDQWQRSPLTGAAFLDWVREHVTDPDEADDLIVCDDCGEPTACEESWEVGRYCDTVICGSCMHEYYTCEDCDTIVPGDDINSIHDRSVCDRCRDDNYSWCDHCDEYYPDDEGCDCGGAEGCDCESPETRFAIRNDGQGMLRNDETVTVGLPAGILDDAGLQAVAHYLYGQDLHNIAHLVYSMDPRWQTKDGNFTKRLSREAYKYDGTKISPAVLSQVGCIARDHSKSVDFSVAVTRELNMSAADFYHEDSCWWQSYSEGRCALKSNGGFGLRSFGEYGDVTGRAWVMPLKVTRGTELAPTFNTETPDAFVVFNAYGNLEGYASARIIAHMAGMTYRKIDFTCPPMYINGDAGYLIAGEDIADQYTDGSLGLYVNQHSNLFYTEAHAATRELASA